MANDLIRAVVGAAFQFAKTMPQNPHEYTLRKNWLSGKQFEEVVQYIRDNGVKENFGGRNYIYFYYAGYKYWSMGAPLSQTILINRAKCKAKIDV